MKKLSSLSDRGTRYKDIDFPLKEYFSRCNQNNYDKTTNPQGVINLGTGENKILSDIVVPKINESLTFVDDHAHYFAFIGSLSFRQSLANFLQYYMKPVEKINPDHLICFNGCGSAIQSLGAAICDPGEGVIIPAPYYGGFDDDLTNGPQIVCIPAHLSRKLTLENKFEFNLTTKILEKSLAKAKEQNIVVRALLLNNPHNPLGIVFTKEEVCLCIKFCQKHSLHFISDEIYLLSVFKEDCSMTPALAIEPGLIDPDFLHVVWGFSKDFGLSGIRAAVVYSRNKDLLAALSIRSHFTPIPAVLQDTLERLISDFDWLDKTLIPINHQRLRHCHDVVSNELKKLGVPFVDSCAGLFIWADMRQFIHPLDFTTEKLFVDTIFDNGVYINFGRSFNCHEPGWFRIVFASDSEIVKIGIERIGKLLKSLKNNLKDKK